MIEINKEDMFKNYPDVLTVSQACEALQIGEGLLYKMLKNKEIYSIRLGYIYRIPKSALCQYIYGN